MVEKIIFHLDQFRDKLFSNGKITDKLIIIASLSLIVTYLLSPKISFRTQIFNKGDVIKNDIISEQDLLLLDLSSSKLKKELLLKNLNTIFDFDPETIDKTSQKIKIAIQEAKQSLIRLEASQKDFEASNYRKGIEYFLVKQKLAKFKKSLSLLKTYQKGAEEKLATIKKITKLSSKQFFNKRVIDNHLKTSQILVAQIDETIAFNINELKLKLDEIAASDTTKEEKIKEFKEEKEKLMKQFITVLGLNNSLSDFDSIFPQLLKEENNLHKILKEFENLQIITSKEIFKTIKNKHIEIRNLKNKEIKKLTQTNKILDILEARDLINSKIIELKIQFDNPNIENVIQSISKQLLLPNITENKKSYEDRKKDILENSSRVYFTLKKGEMIARRGEKATKLQVQIVKEYFNAVSNEEKIPTIVGMLLLTLLAWLFFYKTLTIQDSSPANAFSKIIPIVIICILNILLIKLGIVISDVLESRYFDYSLNITYLFPVAISSMLASILFEFQAGLIMSLIMSLFIAIMMQYNFYFFLFSLSANLMASLPITNFNSRWSLMKHGLKISVVNMIMVIVIFFVQSNQFVDYNLLPSLLVAFFGGIITAIFAPFFLQAFESIFDLTTNLRLLELSNMNHPALKQLMFNAPGTYQHSIVVGNLAESAAMKVGANPLLTRVGAYYHDLGKTRAPNYFIENVGNGLNGHSILKDSLRSAKTIIKHVSDGVSIAKKYRLGKAVTDILAQHHGTTCVRYFYNEAIEKQKKAGLLVEDIKFSDFQYPGPKPQSKASGIVMLADASEASTRSLDDIDEDKITLMVNKVCRSVLEDGQLDESDLTLKEVKIIIETFIDVLTNIYHHRIKYPGQNEELRQQALDMEQGSIEN